MTIDLENMEYDLLTVPEVAKICLVTKRTVLGWIHKRLIPAARLPGNGEYRIRRADLEKKLERAN